MSGVTIVGSNGAVTIVTDGGVGPRGPRGYTGDVTPEALAAQAAAEAARDASAASAAASASSATDAQESASEAAATASQAIVDGNAILASTVAEKTAAQTARTGAETAKAGADTAKAGAEVARTGAETAKTAAELALAGTAANVITTASNVTASNIAATQAQTAANSIGANQFFKSKAAAVTGFAAAANLSTCDVYPDESLNGRATRYRKNTTDNASAWIFVRYVDVPPTYYADSRYGLDTNDGLTPDTPKKSLAALAAAVNGMSGITVALARGAHWKGEMLDLQNTRWSRVITYGQGKRPVVDGASNLFLGTWTQHGTYTNVWYQDIIVPVTSGSTPGDSNRWHVGIWDEAPAAGPGTDTQSRILESYVKRVLNGDQSPDAATFDADKAQTNTIAVTSQAALLTIVNANPNSFTVFPTGTSSYEPNDGVARTAFTVFIRLKDDSNPNTNGRTLVINKQAGVASMGKAMDCQNVIFCRSGGKDMISGFQDLSNLTLNGGQNRPQSDRDIFSGEFRGCSFWEAQHGSVVCGMSFYDCDYVGHYMRDAYRDGNGAYHNFRSLGGLNKGRGYEVVRCKAKRFGYAVYCHGGGDGSDGQHEVSWIDTFWAEDGKAVAVGGTVSQGYWVRNLKARDLDSCGASAYPVTTYENCEIYMRAGIENSIGGAASTLAMVYPIPNAGGARFLNSLVYSLGTSLSLPKTLATMTQASQYPHLTLEKSTIIGNIVAESNSIYRKLNITMDRYSYLGVFNGSMSGDINSELYPTGVIKALGPDSSGNFGSIIECLRTTPETIRAANAGIEAGVMTGMRTQVWQRTIQASDLTWVSINNINATAFVDNGDGTATVTTGFNFGVNNLSRGIKIAGANASGADYIGTIRSWVSNSSIIVSPVPTGSMAGGKALTCGFYRPFPFRDPVTAYLSADGTQLNVGSTTGMVVGQHIRVSHPVSGQASFGIRTITAISGTVITLNQACTWVQRSNKLTWRSISTPTSGTGRSLPTVSVSWGFPIQMRFLNHASFVHPSIKVTPNEGGADIVMIQQLSVLSGSFAQVGLINLAYDSTGATAAYANFDSENGYWSQGFGLAPGDVLTLTSEIDVDSDRLTFNSPPEFAGYNPSPSSLLARRRIGYRPSF